MPLKIGFVTTDHCHFGSYYWSFRKHPDVELVGIWDRPGQKGDHDLKPFDTYEALLEKVDAVAIMSRNVDHAEHIELAAAAGKHILCEKPLVVSEPDMVRVQAALAKNPVKLMVCFPCRYAPAFQRLLERVHSGEIGAIKAICATNHGNWPEGLGAWFVDPTQSGGGAMVDHSVHVADLLWLLLKEEPNVVQAQVSHNLKQREGCEDSGLLTLNYPSGIFATLDSSWSRPDHYKTWGDVTLNVVGENGVIELDMFSQAVSHYVGGRSLGLAGYASDNDALLVADFVRCVLEDLPSPVPMEDGLRATRVFLKAYESLRLAPTS